MFGFRSKTVWIVSAIFWCGLAIYRESGLGLAFAAGLHVVIFYLHGIEVKVNRLLDHYRITVSQKDIDE